MTLNLKSPMEMRPLLSGKLASDQGLVVHLEFLPNSFSFNKGKSPTMFVSLCLHTLTDEAKVILCCIKDLGTLLQVL